MAHGSQYEEAQRRVGKWAFGYVCPFAANACKCTVPNSTLVPKLSFAFDAADFILFTTTRIDFRSLDDAPLLPCPFAFKK